ncbi:MAG: SMC family ATPase [Thermofilaceae archaeon]
MVRIVSLKAENFRRLSFDKPLTFPSGFIIIRGRNEAGKSTILEAILYGIYGDHNVIGALRGGERLGLEGIVNHRAKRARVEVVFEVEGKRYKVERILEREGESARQVDASLVELSEGEAKLLAKGVTKVNEVVQRLIRVSWKEMLATNVIAQKDLERIIEMGKSEREKIINMMMGFESYNKAIERLGKERRELENSLREARAEAEQLANRIAELEEKSGELDRKRAELRQLEERIPQLEAEEKREEEACNYLSEVEGVLVRKRDLKRQLEAEGKRGEDIKSRLEERRVRIERLSAELEELRARRGSLDSELSKVESELERIKRELERLSELHRRAANLSERQKQLEAELEKVRRRIESLSQSVGEQKRAALERERAEAEEALRRVREREAAIRVPAWSVAGAIAVAAFSLLAALLQPAALAGLAVAGLLVLLGVQSKHRHLLELAREADKLRDRISSIDAELKELERGAGELRELRKREAELEDRLKELSWQSSELATELGIQGGLDSLVEELGKLVKNAEDRARAASSTRESIIRQIHGIDATIKAREEERERLLKEVEELEEELNRTTQYLLSLEEEYLKLTIPEPPFEIEGLPPRPSEGDYEHVRELRQERERRLREVQKELAEAREGAKRLREWIEATERELEQLPKLKARLEELRRSLGELELKVKAMSSAIAVLEEVARKRREAFAPSVGENMSWIVSYITDGRYKAVDVKPDTYDVQVYDSEAGRWVRRDIYSGGTNDQFLLAMRIAFTLSLLPAAKGIYPRFLFLDEPLGSSDEERRSRIIDLLSRELTRVFDQVFLITHVDIDEPPGSTVIVMNEGRPEEIRKAPLQESV